MPSNRTKYAVEFRDQTAKHIIESGISATAMSEEIGIDKNTVCRWVRDYRRKNELPSWHEEKRRSPKKNTSYNKDLVWENKVLAKELKDKKKIIANLEEEKEILKKSLAIFTRLPA